MLGETNIIEKNIKFFKQKIKMNEFLDKLNEKKGLKRVKNISNLGPYTEIKQKRHERYNSLPEIYFENQILP